MESYIYRKPNLPPQRVVTLTPEQVDAGWYTEKCYSCGRLFAKLNWHTPSGCDYCHHSFVE